MRAVSLVPSITESLFELGLGESLVAITDYCIYPAEALTGLPRIGGTKNPRVDEIVALTPDVVFANQEENTQAAVEALQAARVNVVVHFPRTVEQAVADLASIVALYGSAAAEEQVAHLAAQVATARKQAGTPLRVFVPIWYEAGPPQWWMTLNQDTFTHDVLALCGFANVFAPRERRYPLAADLGQGAAAQPRDVIRAIHVSPQPRSPRQVRKQLCCHRSRTRLARRMPRSWPPRSAGSCQADRYAWWMAAC